MSEILKLISNAENTRQLLIKSNNEKGVGTPLDASLSEATSDAINIKPLHEGFVVRWIDIDGTLIKKDFFKYGSSIVYPKDPSFDSEFLEFDQWISTCGNLNNITEDIDLGASYKTKALKNGDKLYDRIIQDYPDTEIRPDILKLYINPDYGLSINLQIRVPSTSSIYVDWGDGLDVEKFTGVHPTHTYAKEDLYIVKFWSKDSLRYEYNQHLLSGNSFSNKHILSYYHQNIMLTANVFLSAENCGIISINNNIEVFEPLGFSYNYSLKHLTLNCQISTCYMCQIKSIVIGYNVEINRIYSKLFEYCFNLESIILPNIIKQNNDLFSYCDSLKKVQFHEINNLLGRICYESGLNELNIPKSVHEIGDLGTRAYFKQLIIPNGVESISDLFYNGVCLSLYLPNSLKKCGRICANKKFLCDLFIEKDFDCSLSDLPYLSKNSLINIANNLKDNTLNPSKIINIQKEISLAKSIYLDINGQEVDYKSPNSISVFEKIINKNWTIS